MERERDKPGLSVKKLHLIFIGFILILSILRLPDYLNSYDMPMPRDPSELDIQGTDLTNNNAVNAYILRNSIFKYHDFIPLWNPYYLSGTPFYPKGQKPIFAPLTILLLILPSAWMAIKVDMILHLFLAGLGIYLFVNHLKLKPAYAFISALIYMFNNLMLGEIFVGHTNIEFAYAYLPFIFLFALKAIEKEWLPYSIIIGLVFAMQFHSEATQEILYTLLLFFCFLFINIFGEGSKGRFIKIVKIVIISMLVLGGLAAIKFLPANEILKFGPRSEGFTYERSTLGHLTFASFFPSIIKGGISYIPAILVLFSIPLFKKKNVLKIMLLFAFSILIFSGSFFYKMIWLSVPFFNKVKDLNKGFMVIMFILAVLAAYGAKLITEKTNKKTKIKEGYILSVIVILVVCNLWILAPKYPTMINIGQWIDDNQVMNYMADDKSLFRFYNYESNGIDHGVGHFSVPLGLEDIYGYDAAFWHLEYLPAYLGVASQSPAKLLGMLNVKYLTSIDPVNISGFNFIMKFDRCETCRPFKAAGPYLYENGMFLPRAYIAGHPILVVGEKKDLIGSSEGPNGVEDGTDYVYFLMLNGNFNPEDTLIVRGEETINSYDLDELKKFSAIMLTPGSVNAESLSLLKGYKGAGGIIMPDILAEETSLSYEKIEALLSSFKGELDMISDSNITIHDYDTREIKLGKKSGFLVLSEKFSLFPGWTARIDDKKADILKADGVLSAVYIPEGSEKIVFEYRPKTYIIGRNITIVTLLLIILTSIGYHIIHRQPKVRPPKENEA